MSAAPAQPADDAALLNALRFLLQQLRMGEATPGIKAVVHEMIKRGKVYADAPAENEANKRAKTDKTKSNKKKKTFEAEYEAECPSCLEQRVGRFYKRGFKCNWCAGTANGTHATPVGQQPAHVPSASFPAGFVTLSTDNEEAMQLRPHLENHSTLETDEEVLGVGSSDQPAITVHSDGSFLHRQQSSSVGNFSMSVSALEFPMVRYGVSRFRMAPPSAAAGTADASRRAGTVVAERVPRLRTAYFPTLLYQYSAVRDEDAGEVAVVTEAAKLLTVRGAASPRARARNFEVVMQVALSALHAMQYLKATFETPHGDLRPYNFFVDAQHNVKLRLAPFDFSAPLPAPFQAPEDDPSMDGVPQHADPTMAPFARDMYALGVTLTLVAYGEPCLPSLAEVSAGEETAMVRFLEGLTKPNPNERSTIAEALASRFHSTVRVVNGVPLESIYCRVDVSDTSRSSKDTSGGDDSRDASPAVDVARTASETRASPSASLYSATSFAARSAHFGGSSSALAAMHVPDEPDLQFIARPRADGTLTDGQRMLKSFFESGGPMFQVVRTTGHVTVYSVKKDPRRKSNVSFMDPKSSPGDSRNPSSGNLAAATSATSSGSTPRQRRVSISDDKL